MKCAISGLTVLALMLSVSVHAQLGDAPHPADLEELSALAAAVSENHAAQHNLGVAYAEGLGVSRDLAQAVQWLQEAGAGLLAEEIRSKDDTVEGNSDAIRDG